MGFEQLAALKKQLSEQAKAEKATKAIKKAKPSRARDAASAQPTKPVDPVVHAIAKLQRRFPQAFPKNPAPKLPLKIGIFEDLVPHTKELALTEAELRDAIRTWCRARYWTCLVEGASRVDLTGQEVGHVRPEDAKRARRLKAAGPASARSDSTNARKAS